MAILAGLPIAAAALILGGVWQWSQGSTCTTIPSPSAQTTAAFLNPPELVKFYCGSCHRNGRSGVDFDGVCDLRTVQRNPQVWRHAARQLESGRMPPPPSPQPTAAERAQIVAWIRDGIVRAEKDARAPLQARRLTREEYRNTIRDLLGVPVEFLDDLPSDDDIGWDRCWDVGPLIEELKPKYELAAERIIAKARALTTGQIQDSLEMPSGPSRCRWLEMPASIAEAGAGADNWTFETWDSLVNQLAALARRAYRREPAPEELEAMVAVFANAHRQNGDSQEAMAAVLKAVLTSPHFLFRVKGVEDAEVAAASQSGAPALRDEYLLASRLSYSLWASMPDDELLAAADARTLHGDLDRQTLRMLRDPRAAALTRKLCKQWLGLNKSIPMGDADLQAAMLKETELFVDGIIQEDRSILEFLDADYTYLNERLARHYGIAGVEGPAWRKVLLPDRRRGGLVGHASVHWLTSSSISTSPVQRGKWVLEKLLGTPPPPPPPGLLDAFFSAGQLFKPGTVRQMMTQHTANPSCYACHAQMDALGFALENFDMTGGWRDQVDGQAVDAQATLPSGEIVQGPTGVKAFLQDRRDLFVKSLARHLLGMGLGRPVRDIDLSVCESLVGPVSANHYRFSALLLQVVHSAPFQAGCGSAAAN